MFEPRIVCFFCKWCTYAGADLAGTSRKQYPPNGVVVRVNCSGRIDPQHVLWAFREGADGVLIGGCHPGDCHYQDGNYKTMRRVAFLKRMLKDMGVDPARLHLEWISAAEGEKLVHVMNDFVDAVKEMGPLEMSLAGEGRPKMAPPRSPAKPAKKAAKKAKKAVKKATAKPVKKSKKTAKKAVRKAAAKPAKKAKKVVKKAGKAVKKAAAKPAKKVGKAVKKTTAKPAKKAKTVVKKTAVKPAKKAKTVVKKTAVKPAKKVRKAVKKSGRKTR